MAFTTSGTAPPGPTPTPPYDYTVSGKVVIGGGRSASAAASSKCTGGKVKVNVTHGSKKVGSRTASVKSNCTYKTKVRVKGSKALGKKGKLNVKSRFLGTKSLKPRSTKTVHVKYG